MSSVVLIIVGVAAFAWLALLVAASVRGGEEEVPSNLSPFLGNDELEHRRLDRVLGFSVVLAGFLAVALPIYFLGETNRQERFEEAFAEESIERGAELFEDPQGCAQCHAAGGVGGSASFFDPRSGVEVNWDAPALNDIFYRYDRDEIRFWVVYGRAGSPMPAWGLEGGGAFNDQQVDDLVNYMESIQLPQEEVLATVEPGIAAAAQRREGGDAAIVEVIADQEAAIEVALSAPAIRADAVRIGEAAENLISGLPEDWDGEPGEEPPLMLDTDQDGLTDEAEQRLPALIDEAIALGFQNFDSGLASISLDPRNPVTNGVTPDREVAEEQVAFLSNAALLVVVTADNQDRTVPPLEFGLAALEVNQENAFWEVDVDAVAEATFDGDTERAERAVNLFNANCARCHTSGWSSGAPFAAPIASGGFGPSLQPPRAQIQFQTPESMFDFIVSGSEEGVGYGVNGIGRGYMPGFGASLPAEDIELIVEYLWGDTIGAPDLEADG